MKITFFLIALAIILTMFSSVLLHGLSLLPARNGLRWVVSITYILLFLTLFAGLFLEHRLSPSFAKILTFTGYTFLLFVIYLLMSFLLTDLIRLLNHWFHFAPAGMLVFRQWAAVVSMGIIVVLLIIGSYKFNHPEVVHLDLTVEHPVQHKSLKIVAASDIHLGTSIDKKRLHQYVQLINAQKPDIILLAGDITDRSFGPVLEQKMEEELSQLHAPLGVYAITGNHEYYSGVHDEISQYLRSAGITVLHDSTALVDNSFYIVGRDDRTNPKRATLESLVKGLKPDLPKILLDHQPYALEQASNNGFDLQISGHTHNGQFFPGNLFVSKIFELGHGYMKKGKTHYYVSSGLGIWGPLYRIGTQSELVEIKLKY